MRSRVNTHTNVANWAESIFCLLLSGGSYHICDVVEPTYPEAILCGDSSNGEDGGTYELFLARTDFDGVVKVTLSGLTKSVRKRGKLTIDRDASNANPLLQDLQPDNKLYATSRV